MQKASIAVIVASSALLSGCGVGGVGIGDEQAPPQHVRRSDLARMVGPKRNLWPLVKGLRLDSDDTGRTSNAAETDDTVDPKDTGRSLGRAGRAEGYNLGYSVPGNRPTSLGVLGVGEGVELFRTEEAASAYLKKQIDDYLRFEGRKVEGIKIARAETFESDVGDEARGLRVVVKYNGLTLFGTLVGFRGGRVVGNASATLRRDLLVSGDVDRIADALDDRVQKVASRPQAARSSRPAAKTKTCRGTRTASARRHLKAARAESRTRVGREGRRAASSPSCGDDIRGRTGFARAAVLRPTGPPPCRLHGVAGPA